VMVTHELDIARYCKRNIILRDGLIVSDVQIKDRLIAEEEIKHIKEQESAAKLTA